MVEEEIIERRSLLTSRTNGKILMMSVKEAGVERSASRLNLFWKILVHFGKKAERTISV
jgi:hypothetical protein